MLESLVGRQDQQLRPWQAGNRQKHLPTPSQDIDKSRVRAK